MAWTILSYLIWVSYILIEAIREANLDHLKRNMVIDEVKSSVIVNVQRGIFLLVLVFGLASNAGWWLLFNIIPLISVSFVIHNGTYFYLRNKLNPKIFKDTTSQNIPDSCESPSLYLDFKFRKYLALFALILQIVICFSI